MKKYTTIVFVFLMLFMAYSNNVYAQQSGKIAVPNIGIDVKSSDNPEDISTTLQILLLMTVLSLAPSILIMTTAYLRLIIVLHFLKTALGTQQMPPGQLLAGLALFITFFIMAPTWSQVNEQAIQPLMDGKIKVEEAYDRGIEPMFEMKTWHCSWEWQGKSDPKQEKSCQLIF